MNSKQIECILTVDKTQNFTKSAKLLHMAQPSLSYQIQMAEQEAGFPIFIRTSGGVITTSSGKLLVQALAVSQEMIAHAIELGRNVVSSYQDTIRIGIAMRSVLYYLPDIIKKFSVVHPEIDIVTGMVPWEDPARFLNGEFDLYCGLEENILNIQDIASVELYESRLFLVVNHEDPLAEKGTARIQDLAGRTLMVGGQSPAALRSLQRRIIESIAVKTYNSLDTLTPFVDIKAEKGIGLIPDSMNDHSGEFCWIPFETNITLPYCLCWHRRDNRKILREFISVLRKHYAEQANGPCS